MLSLGFILISDLVAANLFMRSLPGLILLYSTWSCLFYTEGVFAQDIAILTCFTSMHAILIELLICS